MDVASPSQPRRIREWIQDQAAVVIPGALIALAVTLPSWRNRLLWHVGTEDIYYELRDGFLYMSDIALLAAIGAWLLTPLPRRVRRLPFWLTGALLALTAWATISILWSPLRSFATYQAVRLWLLFLLFLVIATTPETRGALAWGLAVSGALQAGLGIAQFAAQRTFGMRDLGEITMRPEWSGASVITVNGEPVLRAYGLTQHPNLLGGFLMVTTLIAIGLAVSRKGWPSAAAGALGAISFIGLLLTFSRAAWLGFALGAAVGALLLIARRREINRRAAALMALILFLIGAAFAVTQWPLLRPRLGLSVEGVEIRSADERSGLEASAWTLIREHPWVGVGYGNFAWALWLRQPEAIKSYPIYQPVHRVPLLATAELGVPGALLWLTLAAGPWAAMWRRRARWPEGGVPAGMAAGIAAALAALTVVGWFDFYPWFSPQGRMLAWICLALWAQTAPRAVRASAGL